MLVIIGYSCASMGTPDGGPYDEMPPKFVRSTPRLHEINAKNQKIELEFDEFIKLEKAAEYAIAFDSYKDGDLYSSLIMYGIETDEHNLWDRGAIADMLERITKQSRYDILKENERYKSIVAKLSNAL